MNKLSAISTARLTGVKQAILTRPTDILATAALMGGGGSFGFMEGQRAGNPLLGAAVGAAPGIAAYALLDWYRKRQRNRKHPKGKSYAETTEDMFAELSAAKAEAEAQGLTGDDYVTAEKEFGKRISDKYNKLL